MGLRDMYSAISGLQANSTWLDVIGNNISNTNTTAYKSSSVHFASSFSQTLSGGTADNSDASLGGVNPNQVGLGTRVQAISVNWTEGAVQNTGISTDVAINGNGFLISKSGINTYLTRAGNLGFDSTGNLTDANGGLIQGFTASLTYTKTTIDTGLDATSNPLAPPLQITSSSLVLDNTNTGAIGNININPNMTLLPKATTQIDFFGNLDSFQQANATGGVLSLWQGPAANQNPVLPIGTPTVLYNGLDFVLNANGQLVQQANLSTPSLANQAVSLPAITTVIPLVGVASAASGPPGWDVGTYAWEQQPPITPALTTQNTVFDSLGNARSVTIQFYQVNDIGAGGVNPAAGPSQVAYAWYAFDTTNGTAVSSASLVGGSGIEEGDINTATARQPGYDRGVNGDVYGGDLIWFNTDGSLGSTGGMKENAGANQVQAIPHIYLPPIQNGVIIPPSVIPLPVSPIPSIGAEIVDVTLNFGTAGVLGLGRRDGLTGDAQGTYQTIAGVNTYVADSHATETQNGYSDGVLTGLSFDATGTINGSFSNGQVVALAQMAMATVLNPSGLNSVGSNYYTASPAAGAETIGTAGSNGMGTITGGALENSNVDLTVELSNMIIAQRGFQVNARVITVESQNLQTLTQLGQ